MKRSVTLFVGVLVLCCAGCGDDGVSPSSFSLEVEVVDADGAPVPGLLMSVVADLPYYQDGLAVASKAAATIPLSLAQTARADLEILDAEGSLVRHLFNDVMSAGRQYLIWDGKDDEGRPLQSGAYLVHLKAHAVDGDSLLFEAWAGMYMALLDFDLENMGVTDVVGRILLTDKRLFPSLLGVEDMQATDENGVIIGQMTFDGSMRFTFADTARGVSIRYHRVIDGPGTVHFVWDPRTANTSETVAATLVGEDPPPGYFSLGPVFPNPFN